MPLSDVREQHIDLVLTRIVAAGAPTVANDVLRHLFRMFHFAVKRRWVEHNPAANFDPEDAGGTERPRERWLTLDELKALGAAMRDTPSFGRINELAVWLLLALCVRKMELPPAGRMSISTRASGDCIRAAPRPEPASGSRSPSR
ncbi:MAG TPA: hypothetical protein VML58_11870 [Burkholderiaceae bacterium]|nr:hypothetical protein [Burkholderiaceae bacterium]